MSDDIIHDTRQPVVTSVGIILGFLLAFLGQWALRDDGQQAIQTTSDWVIVSALFIAVLLLIVVLFRTLSANYPPEQASARYRRTLMTYTVAISLLFAGMGIALFI